MQVGMPSGWLRACAAVLAPAALVAGLVIAGAQPAAADVSVSSGSMTLTVSQATGLPETGGTVTVSGRGYDTEKGIYVAVCVDTGPGNVPTPCLGGMDMSGSAGGSAWISSNPPGYGQGLAKPFGPGGTFQVTLSVVAVDPVTGNDCRVLRCAVVTRADHTRSDDRSSDVRVPIVFGKSAASTKTTTKAGTSKAATTKAATTTSKATTSPATTAESTTSTPAPATSAPLERTPSAGIGAESSAADRATTPASAPSGSVAPADSPAAGPASGLGTASDQVRPAAATANGSGSGGGWVVWTVVIVAVVLAAGVFVLVRRRAAR